MTAFLSEDFLVGLRVDESVAAELLAEHNRNVDRYVFELEQAGLLNPFDADPVLGGEWEAWRVSAA